MRSLKVLALLAAVTLISACTKVPAGNVGVIAKLYGSDKGVSNEEVGPGRYWIGFNEDLFIFPTFTQNYVWTQDANEGSPNDESIRFQSREGMSVSADIGIAYQVDPKLVSTIFQKYRKGVEEITDIHLRNIVRSSLVEEASKQPIESIYGSGKTELINSVKENVVARVAPIGIIIEDIYWIGDPRLPAEVVTSINLTIEATQAAIRTENQLRQTKAEANKVREAAQGVADAKLIDAQAEAKAIQIRGEALAQNPDVVQLNAIEKWNGILPVMTGGSTPIVNVDSLIPRAK